MKTRSSIRRPIASSGDVAEELRRRRVPAGHPLVGVHDDDGDRADLDERLEVLLLATDLRVRERLVGDVHHEALDVCRSSALVLGDPRVVADEHRSSVCRDQAVLEGPAFVTGLKVGDGATERVLPILGEED